MIFEDLIDTDYEDYLLKDPEAMEARLEHPVLKEGALIEACKRYTALGIITHPLLEYTSLQKGAGKKPMQDSWQKQKTCDKHPERVFKPYNNIGVLCGRYSNVTVIDIDCRIKGILEEMFEGVTQSDFVISSHSENNDRYHIYFQYNGSVPAGKYQLFGFDVLSDREKNSDKNSTYIAGDNCVAPPSTHAGDGRMYTFNKDPAQRPIMPERLEKNLIGLINVFNEIKDVIGKCRPWVKATVLALFENKDHPLYHNYDVFHTSSGRQRALSLLGEMKANGLSGMGQMGMCALMYGPGFDVDASSKELRGLQGIRPKMETVRGDEIFAQFAKGGQGKSNQDNLNQPETQLQTNPTFSQSSLDHTGSKLVMFHAFADILLEETHIATIQGNTFLYQDGVYKSTSESGAILSEKITRIAEKNGVLIGKGHVKEIKGILESKTRRLMSECEPDAEHLIICNNGIIDMRDWKLHEFDPTKVYFSKIPVNYNPDAAIPTLFNKYLDLTFRGWPEDRSLMQELAGYTLCRKYFLQKIYYLYGDGGNGKGVMGNLLSNLIGFENISSVSLVDLAKQNSEYYIADLHGKLMNWCGDIGNGRMESMETVKKLCSGTDMITGRRIRCDPIQFINYATLIFAMNLAPEKATTTRGDRRRDVIVRFNNVIGDTTEDIKDLSAQIIKNGELEGILLWAIEGLKRIKALNDHTCMKSVAQRFVEYDSLANPMKYFVEDCILEVEPNDVGEDKIGLRSMLLYEAYETYRKVKGLPSLDQKAINKAFKETCNEISIAHKFRRARPSEYKGKPVIIEGVKLDKEFMKQLKNPQPTLDKFDTKLPEVVKPEEKPRIEVIPPVKDKAQRDLTRPDDEYGDVPGVIVIDFDHDPKAQEKFDAVIKELEEEGYLIPEAVLKEECQDLIELGLVSPDIWNMRDTYKEGEFKETYIPGPKHVPTNEYDDLMDLRSHVSNVWNEHSKEYNIEQLLDRFYRGRDSQYVWNSIYLKNTKAVARYYIQKWVAVGKVPRTYSGMLWGDSNKTGTPKEVEA